MRKTIVTALLILVFTLPSFAQEILIPYQKGKQWGLADTSGSLVVAAKYDSVFNPDFHLKTYYMFLKNGKMGLTSPEKEILRAEHHLLQYHKGAFIRSQVNFSNKSVYAPRLWRYYTLNNGELLCKDTIRSLSRVYEVNLTMPPDLRLIKVSLKNNNFHLFLVDMDKQVLLQKLATNVKAFSFSQLNRNLVKLMVEDEFKKQASYELSYNANSKKIDFKEISIEVQELDEIAEIEEDELYEVVAEPDFFGGKGNSREKKTGKLTEIVKFGFDEKNLVMQTYIGRIDRMGNQSDLKLAESKVYSHIKKKNAAIKEFEANIDKSKFNQFRDLSGDITFNNNYAVFAKKKLIGIVTKYGEIPAQFDNVKGIGAGKERGDVPAFIVGMLKEGRLKYGVIDAKGVWLMNAEYDSLTIEHGRSYWYGVKTSLSLKYLKAKKEGKWYLIGSDYKLTLPDGFDQIEMNQNISSEIQLVNGEKFGYFNGIEGRRRIYIAPKYDYRVKGIRFFNRYKVVILMDEQKNFVGYADLKGFYYFED